MKLKELHIFKYKEVEVNIILNERYINKISVPKDDRNNWMSIDIWKIRSIYVSKKNGKDIFYHLYPELIEINNGDEEDTSCNPCFNNINNNNNNNNNTAHVNS